MSYSSPPPTPTPPEEPTPTPDPGMDEEPIEDVDATGGVASEEGDASTDEPTVSDAATGVDALLSTGTSGGLSDPYAEDRLGWSVGVARTDPYSGEAFLDAVGPDPFVGQTVDPFTGVPSDEANTNPFTGSRATDPFTGAPRGGAFDGLDTSLMLASNGPIQDPSPTPSTNGAPPSDRSVPVQTLSGLQALDVQTINGTDYAHFQVILDGVLHDAYVNDTAYPGQAFVVPVSASDATSSANLANAAPPVPGAAVSTSTSASALATSAPRAELDSGGAQTPNANPASPSRPELGPISPWFPALAGGSGTGMQNAPRANWTYRVLSPDDPTLAHLRAGADLVPRAPDPGNTFQPADTPADMTFRHTRPSGNVPKVGTDRISTARNLRSFGTGLDARGTGELARIDVDAAGRLGAVMRDTEQLLADLDGIERETAQQLEAAREAGRGKNAIRGLENRLNAVRSARNYVDGYREAHGVNRIPSGAITGVAASRAGEASSVAEAAAREARLLNALETVRVAGDVLLVVGIAASIGRVVTAPEGERGRTATQEVTGWAVSLGGAAEGAEAGAAFGAALGIETGPGAIVTGAIGGLIGGIVGFIAGQKVGDAAYDAGEHLFSGDGGSGTSPRDEGYDPGEYFGAAGF